MPKGFYKREGVDLTWSDEMNEWLRNACKTKVSYTDMAKEFNAEFPNSNKTRNALLGRAQRMGLSVSKPSASAAAITRRLGKRDATGVTTPKRVYNQRKGQRIKLMKKAAPVVFKTQNETTLRDEGDRGSPNSPRGARKLNGNDPVVIERKKGSLPAIIEQKPLTSVPVAICEAESCMWPTSEDVTCLEVCGAPVAAGAYCARHAAVAYRVLPTKRRQGTHGKQDLEHTRRIDASQHREALDPDGEWLGRMIVEQVVTAPADEPLPEIEHLSKAS